MMTDRPVPRRKHQPLAVTTAQVLALAAEGKSRRTIGDELRISRRWVAFLLNRAGAVVPRVRRDSRVHHVLPLIIQRLRAGESQSHISREIGYSVRPLVWQVRNGRFHAPELLALVGPARRCVRRDRQTYR